MAIAPARSRSSGYALTSSASDEAKSPEAPMPCTTRAALSMSIELASAQTSEAAVKTTRPAAKTLRRPKRSASEPTVRTVVASASV